MLTYILGALLVLSVGYYLFSKRSSGADLSTAAAAAPSPAAKDDSEDAKLYPMKIVFGSQSGTAETFSYELQEEAKRHMFGADVVDMEEYEFKEPSEENPDKIVFANEKLLVLLLATFGEGEPTDSAVEFYEWIMDKDLDLDLTGVHFAVFALGNRQYENFCNVGRNVAKRMKELGATELIAHGEGDDDGSLEDDYAEWRGVLWPELTKRYISAEDAAAAATQSSKFEASFNFTMTEEKSSDDNQSTPHFHFDQHKYENAGFARVTVNRELRQTTDDGGSTRHIELDVSEMKVKYRTADNLGIFPHNPHKLAAKLAKRLGVRTEQRFTLTPKDSTGHAKKLPYPAGCSVMDALLWYTDISDLPSRRTLEILSEYATDAADKAKLLAWCGDKKEEYHQEKRNLLEVLEETPSVQPPFNEFLEWVPHIQPRFYTLASSSVVSPTSVHVTVTILTEDRRNRNTPLKGLCSTYLQNLKPGKDMVPVFVRQSSFVTPWSVNADPVPPAIMIGPGTGLAPFRAFVQEAAHRKQQGQPVGEMVLFFGCKKRDQDFIYKEELTAAEANGVLTKLVVAFSREQEQKVYVQHRMAEFSELLWELIWDKKGYFYVCGGTGMGRDVRTALLAIAQKVGGLSEDDAAKYVKDLQTSGRYIQELWT